MHHQQKKQQIIPGFGRSMGITITMLSLVVLIPLASLVMSVIGMDWKIFWTTVTSERVMAGYQVSFTSALVAALINGCFGVVIAWVLVRYDIPMKRLVDGMIELPFALPTAVAGIALTTLYSDHGMMGKIAATFGVKIAYTRVGIIIAMVFIGIPFVVRTIQPVLSELSGQYEEAASILGASKTRIFFQVILPEIRPALLTGIGLSFARAIGEYGSVVFIAGNTPYKTEIAPLLIMSKLEQYDYQGANAIAMVMLGTSFLILLVLNTIEVYHHRFTKDS